MKKMVDRSFHLLSQFDFQVQIYVHIINISRHVFLRSALVDDLVEDKTLKQLKPV